MYETNLKKNLDVSSKLLQGVESELLLSEEAYVRL